MNVRYFFRLHSYLGLLTGLLLLVVSLSGCILVFAEEIDGAFHPEVLHVQPGETPLQLENIYRQVRKDFPHIGYVRFRTLPKTQDSAIEMSLEHGKAWYFAYYDPYTGRLLGVRNADTYFLGWLLNLHYSLLAGTTGEYIVALLALSLVLSTLTGLVVYRKHLLKVILFRAGFKFTSWRTTSSSLHRLIGVWSVVFNLGIALTGFWMLRHLFTDPLVASTREVIQANWPLTHPIDTYIEKAKEALPGLMPYGVWLPQHQTESVLIFGRIKGSPVLHNEYSSTVTLHPMTADLISVDDARQRNTKDGLDIIALPLHSGQFGGLLVKMLYCLSALAPAMLTITGSLLYLRRTYLAKPKRKKRMLQPK